MKAFSVLGTLIHAPVLGELEILPAALVEVDGSGDISAVHRSNSESHANLTAQARQEDALIELSDSQYLLPGMIDLHIHAPQWPQMGGALHLPLYDWLQQCTFPLEAKYADLEFADKVYSSLVETLIANGTTTALYFATIHLEPSKRLAEICVAKGQRGLVGKVAMDNPAECPDFYRDASTEQGLDDTRALINYIREMPGNESARVLPVVTPRFIPSCTDEMLKGLGEIAKETNCHVQTHCSESDWEHNYVIERHGTEDTNSLNNFGLLGNKTVLAHSNFISEADMQLIKQQGSGIAHCPLSNYYFSNAVFPARKALDQGLDVGLGTDISGGPNPSLLHNCNVAVTSSRALEEGVNPELPAEERGVPGSRINFKEAFWMATSGGGRALDLKIGQISEGYAMDAMVVDTAVSDSNLITWDESDDLENVLQKILYNADRNNITKVWVQGEQIK
ncbi:MAG: guanine deaminase [Gammaproteobacteria bacterium]|nr:guanine deaminase [Gammaproteobacteria bacterium]